MVGERKTDREEREDKDKGSRREEQEVGNLKVKTLA